jgi:hypothetical protein
MILGVGMGAPLASAYPSQVHGIQADLSDLSTQNLELHRCHAFAPTQQCRASARLFTRLYTEARSAPDTR